MKWGSCLSHWISWSGMFARMKAFIGRPLTGSGILSAFLSLDAYASTISITSNIFARVQAGRG
eukprot:138755-Rhodomonas_salina.1